MPGPLPMDNRTTGRRFPRRLQSVSSADPAGAVRTMAEYPGRLGADERGNAPAYGESVKDHGQERGIPKRGESCWSCGNPGRQLGEMCWCYRCDVSWTAKKGKR